MTAHVFPSPAKSSAAGQYLGYSLQQVRLCFHLLSAQDDDWVSLELVDDVAVHRPDGSILLEQSKSALSGNPTTNKSEELWKTFANWIDTCAEKKLAPEKTNFRYYVSPAKKSVLVGEMAAAATKAEALKILAKLTKVAAEADPELGWLGYLNHFLKAGEGICGPVIERFEFVTDADPIECIRNQLLYLPEETRADYPAAIIGLARDRMDALIREGKPRRIRAGDFRRAVFTFISRHNFSNVLLPSGGAPDQAVVQAIAEASPLFVRQLVAIEARPQMMMSAVSDYLRTTADKTHWAESGVVLEDSFTELDTQLQRQHGRVCDEIDDVEPHLSGAERGRRVYRRCSDTQMPLEGQNLPSYFIAGAFNCLAQSRRVGWHPDYLTLFPAE